MYDPYSYPSPDAMAAQKYAAGTNSVASSAAAAGSALSAGMAAAGGSLAAAAPFVGPAVALAGAAYGEIDAHQKQQDAEDAAKDQIRMQNAQTVADSAYRLLHEWTVGTQQYYHMKAIMDIGMPELPTGILVAGRKK